MDFETGCSASSTRAAQCATWSIPLGLSREPSVADEKGCGDEESSSAAGEGQKKAVTAGLEILPELMARNRGLPQNPAAD